jgi:hypothetical protein
MSKDDREREKFLLSIQGATKKPRPEPEKRDALGYRVPESRIGRQGLTTLLQPEFIRQFKKLAFSQEKSQQAMVEEALNLFFKQYGLPEIA